MKSLKDTDLGVSVTLKVGQTAVTLEVGKNISKDEPMLIETGNEPKYIKTNEVGGS